MGIAVALLALGTLFGVVSIVVHPGAFAVVIAVVCFVAAGSIAALGRTRVGDRSSRRRAV